MAESEATGHRKLGTDGTFLPFLYNKKSPKRGFTQFKLFLEIYGGDDETRTRGLCRDKPAL